MEPSGLTNKLPRRTLLDVRRADAPGWVADSVRIPVDELLGRLSELPPPYKEVCLALVDGTAREAAHLLEQGGRTCKLVEASAHETEPLRGRLWDANPLVEVAPPGDGRLALDLGCGAGRDAVALLANGWHVHAVDRLESAVRRTVEMASRYLDPADRAHLTEQVADARTADLGGPYDLITLFSWWDLRMVDRLGGLLRSGGTLLIEAFTPEHRARYGRPGPHAVVDSDRLADLLHPLVQLRLEAGDRGDRITARGIFTKQ